MYITSTPPFRRYHLKTALVLKILKSFVFVKRLHLSELSLKTASHLSCSLDSPKNPHTKDHETAAKDEKLFTLVWKYKSLLREGLLFSGL